MICALALSLSLSDPVPVDENLRQELAQRDAVIAELLARVARLEALVSPSQSPGLEQETLPVDLERALEMVLVDRGARLLPSGTVELTPSATWTHQTEKSVALTQAAGGPVALEEEIRASDVTVGLSARLGLPAGFQAEVSIPYRIVNRDLTLSAGATGIAEASQSASGFGDIGLSVAKALTDGNGSVPMLIARLGGDLGNAKRSSSGLDVGGGFASLGGSLTAVERLDPLVFVGSLRYSHGLSEDNIDPGDSHGGSIGAYLAAGPETSLRFVFDYSRSGRMRLDGVALPGTRRTSAIFTIGASIATGAASLLDVSAGIGLTEDSPDFALSVAMPIRP